MLGRTVIPHLTFGERAELSPGLTLENNDNTRLQSQARTATGPGLPGSRPVWSWPRLQAQLCGRLEQYLRFFCLLEAQRTGSDLRDTSKSRVSLCTLIGSGWQTAAR